MVTPRDLSFTLLRFASLICLMEVLLSVPVIFHDLYLFSHRETYGIGFLAASIYVFLLIVSYVFWFKARLLSAFFALDKTSPQSEPELSDWYNLGCILIGIYLIGISISPLAMNIGALLIGPVGRIFVSTMQSSNNLDLNVIRIIGYVLQVLIGLILIFKKHGILNLIHNIRSK